MRVSSGAPSVQANVWHETHFKSHNLKTNNKKICFDQKTGIGLVLWTWTKRWDEQWKDKQRQKDTQGTSEWAKHTERMHTYVWMLSRCSCDGQIRDSGVEAASKSRSIIHRDRSSHCRKLWKQNIHNGLSHPIHKRQLTVTQTHTHTNAQQWSYWRNIIPESKEKD